MPTYPASLPSPMLDGYSLRPVDGGILRGMDGLARQRRRHATGHEVTLTWLAEPGDFALLSQWLDTYGMAWFTITLSLGDTAAPVTARLVGTWSAAHLGTHWRVTATMEVRP
jgi:hypothetical protein